VGIHLTPQTLNTELVALQAACQYGNSNRWRRTPG
jgi:hypothetical protein